VLKGKDPGVPASAETGVCGVPETISGEEKLTWVARAVGKGRAAVGGRLSAVVKIPHPASESRRNTATKRIG
jgi:hypothetical protein